MDPLTTSPTDLVSLQKALQLVSDAVVDTQSALQPGESALAKLFAYENLVPDLLTLIPQIGTIPAAVTELTSDNVTTLVNGFVTSLNVTSAHAEAIIAASLKVLNDVVFTVIPDSKTLVSAIQASGAKKA